MKKLTLLLFTIILTVNLFAQDTLQTYPDSISFKYKPEKYWGTASVIFGTFVINQSIIRHDAKYGSSVSTSRKAGTVYAIGVTMSVVVFSFEYKRQLKNNELIRKSKERNHETH